MKRVQFFEIEDQSWCPAVIRDGITDYLQFTIDAAQSGRPVGSDSNGIIPTRRVGMIPFESDPNGVVSSPL